jgi:uncharacterized membrane protein
VSRRTAIFGGLALIGLGIATYLTVVHYSGGAPVCAINHGCETVQKSKYAELGGVPVALIGLIGYVSILASLVLRGELGRLIRAGLTAIGFAFSAYLTAMELFQIHAICQWCVASAVVMTLLLILAIRDYLSPLDPDDSSRYSSLADTPVSSATTAAAGRTRAPASTSRRSASSADARSADPDGAPPTTSTISPRTSPPA